MKIFPKVFFILFLCLTINQAKTTIPAHMDEVVPIEEQITVQAPITVAQAEEALAEAQHAFEAAEAALTVCQANNNNAHTAADNADAALLLAEEAVTEAQDAVSEAEAAVSAFVPVGDAQLDGFNAAVSEAQRLVTAAQQSQIIAQAALDSANAALVQAQAAANAADSTATADQAASEAAAAAAGRAAAAVIAAQTTLTAVQLEYDTAATAKTNAQSNFDAKTTAKATAQANLRPYQDYVDANTLASTNLAASQTAFDAADAELQEKTAAKEAAEANIASREALIQAYEEATNNYSQGFINRSIILSQIDTKTAAKETAQANFEALSTVEDLTTANNLADTQLTEAQTAYDAADAELTTKTIAKQTAQADLDARQALVDANDQAQANLVVAQDANTAAIANYNQKVAALQAADDARNQSYTVENVNNYWAAFDNLDAATITKNQAQATLISVATTLASIQQQLDQAADVEDLNNAYSIADSEWNIAQTAFNAAESELETKTMLKTTAQANFDAISTVGDLTAANNLAGTQLAEAQTTYDAADAELTTKTEAKQTAQADLDARQALVDANDQAQTNLVLAQDANTAAIANYNQNVAALQAADDARNQSYTVENVDNYWAAFDNLDAATITKNQAQATLISVATTLASIQQQLDQAADVGDLNNAYSIADSEWNIAQTAFNAAESELETKTMIKTYTQANLEYNQATSELEAAQAAYIQWQLDMVPLTTARDTASDNFHAAPTDQSLTEANDQAEAELAIAQTGSDAAQADLTTKSASKDRAQLNLEAYSTGPALIDANNLATTELAAAQTALDTANGIFITKTTAKTTAQTAFNTATTASSQAQVASDAAAATNTLSQAAKVAADQGLVSAQTSVANAQSTVTSLQADTTAAETALEQAQSALQVAQTAYENAQPQQVRDAIKVANDSLSEAQSQLTSLITAKDLAVEAARAAHEAQTTDDGNLKVCNDVVDEARLQKVAADATLLEAKKQEDENQIPIQLVLRSCSKNEECNGGLCKEDKTCDCSATLNSGNLCQITPEDKLKVAEALQALATPPATDATDEQKKEFLKNVNSIDASKLDQAQNKEAVKAVVGALALVKTTSDLNNLFKTLSSLDVNSRVGSTISQDQAKVYGDFASASAKILKDGEKMSKSAPGAQIFVKSVVAGETIIETDAPLVVGDRTYKAPTITLPLELAGSVSAVSIVTVDPASYTKGKLSSPIIRVTLYDVEGKVIEPSPENPITVTADVDTTVTSPTLAYFDPETQSFVLLDKSSLQKTETGYIATVTKQQDYAVVQTPVFNSIPSPSETNPSTIEILQASNGRIYGALVIIVPILVI